MSAMRIGSPARREARSSTAWSAYSPLTELCIGVGWRNHLYLTRDCTHGEGLAQWVRAHNLKFRAPTADMFGMFEWKNEYAIGIGSIDAQHQNLFALGDHMTAHVQYGEGFPRIPSWQEVPFFKPQKKIVLRNCGLISPDDIEE